MDSIIALQIIVIIWLLYCLWYVRDLIYMSYIAYAYSGVISPGLVAVSIPTAVLYTMYMLAMNISNSI